MSYPLSSVFWYGMTIPVEVRPIAVTRVLIYRVGRHRGAGEKAQRSCVRQTCRRCRHDASAHVIVTVVNRQLGKENRKTFFLKKKNIIAILNGRVCIDLQIFFIFVVYNTVRLSTVHDVCTHDNVYYYYIDTTHIIIIRYNVIRYIQVI